MSFLRFLITKHGCFLAKTNKKKKKIWKKATKKHRRYQSLWHIFRLFSVHKASIENRFPHNTTSLPEKIRVIDQPKKMPHCSKDLPSRYSKIYRGGFVGKWPLQEFRRISKLNPPRPGRRQEYLDVSQSGHGQQWCLRHKNTYVCYFALWVSPLGGRQSNC